jgi:hypothetical protein
MANVNFQQVSTNNIPDQAIDYLQDACDAIEGYCTLEMAFRQVDAGIGLLYCVFVDSILSGCLFINFRLIDQEKKMALILLGSERNKLHIWANDLVYFLRIIKKQHGAKTFTVLGREGFGRIFKQLRHIACVFEGE